MSESRASTIIRGGTIIAFNGKEHCQLDDGVVVIKNDRIAFVGKSWDGEADRDIDARRKTVIPGLISTHAHIGAYEGPRCLLDSGLRKFVRSGFLHFMPTRRSTGRNFYALSNSKASILQGFASLLRHGVTTAVDYYEPSTPEAAEAMAETANQMGLRLYWAPAVTGGRYWLEDDGRVQLELNERDGLQMLERTAAFIERFRGANDGRLMPVVIVDEYYASTPTLRMEAKKLARSLNAPFTMHFLEQHREFFDTMFATGKTPVQLLAEEDVLGPGTILAHCVYVASHTISSFPVVDDLAILGASKTCVSHSPSGFARRGIMLESFDSYSNAGITMSLGTDMYPLELFSEMRTASTMCKMAELNYEAAPAQDVFAAATLGGARALGRDDLGRISAGAKADIVVVDTDNLEIGHNPDPLRALVHFASANMVDTVIIDGRILVDDKRVLVCDEREIREQVKESSERVWSGYPAYHPDQRPIYNHFPRSIPQWIE